MIIVNSRTLNYVKFININLEKKSTYVMNILLSYT